MLRRLLTDFGRARAGAAGVEYVVLVSGIGAVLLVAIYLLGEDMSGYWNDLNRSLKNTPN